MVYGLIQTAVEVHKRVGRPELVLEFFPGDHLPRTFQQHGEDLESLISELDLQALLTQLPGLRVDMRLRSNNFMIDGQDTNMAQVTGENQRLNNPDLIAEVRLVTNQFAPEYGNGTGAILNVITKNGGNDPHGTAFWFHNDNHLNARTNLEKQVLFSAPYRIENEFGGTLGGPVAKDKTFFFGSLERWTDRRLGTGNTIRGVPSIEGRTLLNAVAGDRPAVRMLLDNLPAAQSEVAGLSAPVTIGGPTVQIPLGTLTGTSHIVFNAWQASGRVDHRLNGRHTIGSRYLLDDSLNSGDGQVSPPNLTTVTPLRRQS